MSRSYVNQGLVEVLKRPCSGAAQPVEYHSTIRRVTIPEEVAQKVHCSVRETKQRPLPRPVGTVTKQAQNPVEMKGLVTVISKLENRSVSFIAPAGVGKSTAFPWELHQNTATVVVVLSPTELVAQAHVEEVKGLGQLATYISPARMSVTSLNKSMGVVYTTAAGLIMRALAAMKDAADLDAEMTVVHDESHAMDADSQFLASMWPDYDKVVKFISVSAYGVPRPASELYSPQVEVVSVPFCEEAAITPADETMDGKPAPWAVANLLGKRTLMFIESDRIADYLASAYGNFLETMTLRRHQGFQQYMRAVATLSEKDKSVLILADAEFQNGIKLPADQIVDFGYARHTDAGAGLQPTDIVTRVNAIDAAARVNSIATRPDTTDEKPKVAYVPDDPTSDVVRQLSRPETDKLAAYCDLFSYKAPPGITPTVNVDLFKEADTVAFLQSGLPWEIWSNTSYRVRPECVKPPDKRGELSTDNILDWIGAQQIDPGPIQLKSGQFYSDEQGNVSATSSALETIMTDYGDLYLWLREKVRGPSILRFADLSDHEQDAVWLIWLTVWNANVADLIALDKWRAIHGAAVTDWKKRTDCRVRMSMLLKVARDIHDKWVLLSSWYQLMYQDTKKFISEAQPDEVLIDARFAGLVTALGTSIVARHPIGSTSLSTAIFASPSVRGIAPTETSGNSEMLIPFTSRMSIRDRG